MAVVGSETPTPSFPHRLFAVGEEPLGIRVTPYHKPSCISKILNALEEEEIDCIRQSPFGKLIEIASKPSFSGRFGRFLIFRQLKVSKRHESWFLFAGKPVRFSIREFALVTGLNCCNYPPYSKKRNKRNISEKPYWGDLFGTMKDVPVIYVISMLKKKTVTDPKIRIKYAFLALLASVVLPTSHTPLMKERNEVSLSDNTIAFKGFVMPIQLVMIEAVPSLIGVVRDGGSSDSEDESADDDDNCDEDKEGKKSINPGHVRDIDTACKAQVFSIISAEIEQMNVNPELGWSDDEEDVHVENLVKCIEEGFSFSNYHFTGGATKADVIRMCEEAKKENVSRKSAKTKSQKPVTDAIDADYVANIVKNSVAADLSKMSEQIKDLTKSLTTRQTLMQNKIRDILDHYMWDIRSLINTPCNRPHVIPPHNTQPGIPVCHSSPGDGSLNVDPSNIIQDALRAAFFLNIYIVTMLSLKCGRNQWMTLRRTTIPTLSIQLQMSVQMNWYLFRGFGLSTTSLDTVATGPVFPNPTFSLGLTQINKQDSDAADNVVHHMSEDAPLPLDENDAPTPNRKSKRPKIIPMGLVGEYQCEKRFLTRAWEAYVNIICSSPNIDYAAKFVALLEKLDSSLVIVLGSLNLDSRDLSAIVERSSHLPVKVVDILVQHTRSVFLKNSEHIQSKNSVFLDTNFANRFYFPFNFDKQHWVGGCIDSSLSQVIVLDCNTSLRTDRIIAKELRPISQMFPYLLRQSGKSLNAKDLKPLTIERPRIVPQNNNQFESGVTSILIIHVHAVGGVDVCKCITPDVLDVEVQRIVVMIYEENLGVL
ncbi:hypothetical protein N665_0426s0007 [Sinapis alba]|nr:hypothetical protein N665_0426s0007 [Sinapis alba]